MAQYDFTRNDPYDRTAPVRIVLSPLIPSREYMRSIRSLPVAPGTLAVWFFGQNGFVLKGSSGSLVGIDLYLTTGDTAWCEHNPADYPSVPVTR